MKRIAFITLALILPFHAAALGPDETYPDIEHETPLSQTELELTFKGKKHLGSYNFLYRDITSFAFEETTRKDGSIRHVQQGNVDTGNWVIEDNTICYDYNSPTLRQACFKIYARGNCYYHYQVSTEGLPQFGFTARSVIDGETPNCEPSFV